MRTWRNCSLVRPRSQYINSFDMELVSMIVKPQQRWSNKTYVYERKKLRLHVFLSSPHFFGMLNGRSDGWEPGGFGDTQISSLFLNLLSFFCWPASLLIIEISPYYHWNQSLFFINEINLYSLSMKSNLFLLLSLGQQ